MNFNYEYSFSFNHRELLEESASVEKLYKHNEDDGNVKVSKEENLAIEKKKSTPRMSTHERKRIKNDQLCNRLDVPRVIEYDANLSWTLPAECVCLAYALCLLISTFAILVIIVYGQTFGYEKVI
jgi:hypothetical protein